MTLSSKCSGVCIVIPVECRRAGWWTGRRLLLPPPPPIPSLLVAMYRCKSGQRDLFCQGILHKSKRFLPSRSNHLDRFRNRIRYKNKRDFPFHESNPSKREDRVERSEQRAERENESTRNRSISPRESPYSASLFIKHSDCRVYQRLFANTPSGNRISGNGSTVGRRKTVG